MIKIIPAILEQDYLKIKDALEDFSKVATTIQIDVCESDFVKNKVELILSTWLPNNYEDLNGYSVNLEFDMMVLDIEKYLEALYRYDAKKIIMHTRDMSIVDCMSMYDKIKEKNHFVQVAVCDSDIEKIKSLYGYYDYVQVMGIENIGVQGQAFDTNVIQKIKDIKNFLQEKENIAKQNEKRVGEIFIQIDGAMSPDTIKICKDAGATSFVVGSYLKNAIKENKLKEAYANLKNI